MGISLLLGREIMALFLMGVVGYVIVKMKMLKAEDSEVLSKLCVYVFSPCVVVNSFQIVYTKSKLAGLGLSFAASILVHVVFILIVWGIGKAGKFDQVEKASLIYTNAGYLTVPLVMGAMGEEWVFYTSAYLVVFLVLIWTHGVITICKGQEMNFKKIITNPNIIACVIGFVLFITQVELPAVIGTGLSGFAKMVGPTSMLVIGMLMGNVNLKTAFKQKSVYLISLLRLVVLPFIVILLIKISGVAGLHPDGKQIMCIVLIAASAPVAAAVTQIAQVNGREAGKASLINAVSVIFCVITMPLMILIYEWLI